MNTQWIRIAVGLALAGMLAACGGGKPDDLVKSAREHLAKNDSKAAIIQLKSALQAKSDHVEARVLLGTTLLDMRDAAGAEVELNKARELKAPDAQVLPKLAEAMAAQGKFKKVTDEFSKVSLQDGAAQADLLVTVAGAWAAQNNAAAYEKALQDAIKAQPGHSGASVLLARRKAAQGDFDGALADANAVIAKDAKYAEAHRLKGDIQAFAMANQEGALASYRQAIEARPNQLPAHFSAVSTLLRMGKIDDAKSQLTQARKVAGGHPQVLFYQTQLALASKDLKAARESSQQLLKVAPNHPPSLQLAGAIELQSNSLLQAETFLSKALSAAPDLSLARRLLMQTYLRSGQQSKAVATIPSNMAAYAKDADMLFAVGEVYLQTGDAKRAAELFAQASKLDPKDPRRRTALAVARLGSGQADQALGDLADIAASDSGTSADLALVSAHLRRNDFDKALKALDALEKKQAGNPLVYELRAKTLVAKRDLAGARGAFEKALSVAPTYFPAAAGLAGLDLADKKPESARKRFEDLLAKDPKNVQALVALIDLRARSGATAEEQKALIDKAVAASPGEPAPRLLQVSFHLRNKDPKQALSAAQNAVAALPDNADVLDALGGAQKAAGELNQAVTTYNKLAGLQPLSPTPHLRLADVHMAAKNPEAAAQSLRKALEIKPDLLAAQRGLAGLQVQGNKPGDAIAVAQAVQKQRPKEAIGYSLEADIHVSQKKLDAAVLALRSGLKQVPNATELAVKLNALLAAGGKAGEAGQFAASWVKEHPKDAVFIMHLGDQAIVRRDYAAAEKQYLAAMQIQPNQPLIYNNLAWVSGQLGRANAIELAEKAVSMAPGNASFIDTLAMLHSGKAQHAKAIELQTKVLSLQPDNALFKLNMARIHLAAGDKAKAKPLLTDLQALGDKFGGQAEVAKLLAGT